MKQRQASNLNPRLSDWDNIRALILQIGFTSTMIYVPTPVGRCVMWSMRGRSKDRRFEIRYRRKDATRLRNPGYLFNWLPWPFPVLGSIISV